MKKFSIVKNGILDSNPSFVQLLGMCPLLAVTTSAFNAIGMGLSATAVLMCSNLAISLLKNFIPNKIRIASYVVVIAGFVTTIEMLLHAFLPDLYESLGLFIPLIVVNCIILARAESFASRNKPFLSVLDGLGMGLGFTLGLLSVSLVRELFGNGTLFSLRIFPADFSATIMILPPGAFLALGIILAILAAFKARKENN